MVTIVIAIYNARIVGRLTIKDAGTAKACPCEGKKKEDDQQEERIRSKTTYQYDMFIFGNTLVKGN